jgi:hypothetical protein
MPDQQPLLPKVANLWLRLGNLCVEMDAIKPVNPPPGADLDLQNLHGALMEAYHHCDRLLSKLHDVSVDAR